MKTKYKINEMGTITKRLTRRLKLGRVKRSIAHPLKRPLIIAVIIIFGVIITISALVLKFYKHAPVSSKGQRSDAMEIGVVGNLSLAPEKAQMDIQELLGATNKERESNNNSLLVNKDLLNKSAQAKCEDMVAKNYWSHNDPSGKEPWRFIDAAGYRYEASGENLAYGFWTSSEVVGGWMNSPTHRNNLLDPKYVDVGFGICISDNYLGAGKQTIVVQHLSIPQVPVPSTSVPASKPAPAQKPYVPFVCSKTPIPRKTVYIEASYLYEGETSEGYSGMDGYKETCTADSAGYKPPDFTSPPSDRTIYTGTKPRPSTTPPPSSP
jgi:uncharacterized protein YkwD